ncbi:DUF4180 domain-containing protein [Sphingobacterium sp. SRCM116780]|uniref:DUF4180 domain-containing protein n=1 Tax=Sphingobacterium sp. SRCM116780 TaxID=2907623 RepID=UPI001F30A073|nr:DUF4180 domain-containing protein [Sphingobacterium sp. SRCM116780]UIR57408.1 DUF4180 domain-containing protein [Sphingobacterium sp. SRCM116780]
MEIHKHEIKGNAIAEVITDNILISTIDDAIDLLGNLYYQGYDSIILYEKNIIADFFDLKNKMAGEILQKFSNYRVRLVLIGNFSPYTSNSLQDFIRESNKGKHIHFKETLEEALDSFAR